jgi:3-oxoacyl-[acyl-carrier-protein] synthase-3
MKHLHTIAKKQVTGVLMNIAGYGHIDGSENDIVPDDVARKTGISTRMIASDTQDQITMGCDAARLAMEMAGLDFKDIDLVISAASVPYQPIPSLSAIYLSGLGVDDGLVETMDINTTCLSFLTALRQAAMHLDTGAAETILIISSEVPSRAIDIDADPYTAAIFSDGAAAFVLTRGAGIRMPGYLMRTYPSGREYCHIAAGGTRFPALTHPDAAATHGFFKMRGLPLLSLTKRHMPDFMDRMFETSGLCRQDIDLVIPHQASPHGLAMIGPACGLDQNRVLDLSRTRGNRVAASIPDTLAFALRKGKISSGSRILLSGTSAGVSLGAMILEFD